MSDYVNQLELCVFGIRRSGNHALIGWIMQHFEGRLLHLNNIHTQVPDPYRSFFEVALSGFSRYACHRKRLGVNRYLFDRRPRASLQYTILRPRLARGYLRQADKRLLVLSYEEVDLHHPRVQRFLEDGEPFVGASKHRKRLLILRDPYNLFASLLKSGMMTYADRAYYAGRWKHYAREFVGETRHLGEALIPVQYNDWCTDAHYRTALAERIGFVTDGVPYGRVSGIGGGSSFQGVPEAAAALQPAERWKAYWPEPSFRDLFDPDMVAYAEQIFRINPFVHSGATP